MSVEKNITQKNSLKVVPKKAGLKCQFFKFTRN